MPFLAQQRHQDKKGQQKFFTSSTAITTIILQLFIVGNNKPHKGSVTLFHTWLLLWRGDAFTVPFFTCPEATFLINITNTSAWNCLLKNLNEMPLPSCYLYKSSYPHELCAVFYSSHSLYAVCTKAKKPCNCFFPPSCLVISWLKYS